MQMDISRKDLLSLLDRCAPAARDGAIMTMARMLRLEATVTGLRCYAIGATISIESIADAVPLSPGICQADSVRLSGAASAMPDGLVRLKYGADKLTLSAGKRRFTVPTFHVEDFPEIPKASGDVFTIAADAIASCIERTMWARDTDRDFLNGVQLSIRPGQLMGVALRSSAWAIATVPIRDLKGSADIFCPEKLLRSILEMCSGSDSNKTLELSSDGRRTFVRDTRTLLGSLMPAQPFMNWQPVFEQMEKSTVDSISVDGSELADAARACVVAAGDDRRTRGMALTFGKDFSVALDRTDGAEIDGGIELESTVLLEDARRVVVDGDNLVHAAKHCSRAIIGGGLDAAPLRIRSEDGTYQAVMAPIRLR